MIDDLGAFDILGIIGSLMICWGYFAVSTGRMSAGHTPYQWLNVIGSGLLLVSLYFRPNPGAILIEVLWLSIGVWSLWRIWRR